MDNNLPWPWRRLSKLLTLLVIAALMSTSLFSQASAAKQELNLLIWSDYINPDVIAEFEKKRNVTVKLSFFVSDDDRDEILQDNNAEGYDIVVINDPNLASYIKRGWLAPIPKNKIANRKYLNPRFTALFSEAEEYAVAYFWGTLGIAYRADLTSKPITSWNDIFQPAEELQHKIAMLGSARDLVGMALKANGHSANSESKQALIAAENLIKQQAPFVKSYSYISLQENSGLVTGEIIAAMAFSGDAVALKEFNENIRYVVPKEGGNVWVDYMAILTHSQQKSLAMDFIDFLNQPENAARQAEYVYFPTPNKAAEQFLPKEFLKNTEIYPTKEVLEKSERYHLISPRAMKKRHEIFSHVSN